MNTENEKVVRDPVTEALTDALDLIESEYGLLDSRVIGVADIVANLKVALQSQSNTDGWVMVPVEPTEEMLREGKYAFDDSAETSFRDIFQAMLSATPKAPQQESNTSQDGSSEATRHATALEQCAIFAADVGDNIAKAMTDAAAYLRTVSTPPQQQEQSGEAVAWMYDYQDWDGNINHDEVTTSKEEAEMPSCSKVRPLFLAPPTSTAIAAMVIKQAANCCEAWMEPWDIQQKILALTPANAKAELEALKYDACINVAAELANEYGLPFGDSDKITAIVRRVLDEAKGEVK